jgi:hypothetical protein
MTATETKEILRLVFGAYPTQRQRLQPDDVRAMLDVWSLALADVPFELVKAAIARLICTSKWIPAIAEVRAELTTVLHGRKRSGLDAWGDVRQLGIYREGTEGVDPLALQVCQRFGWVQTRVLWRDGRDVQQWNVATGENEESDRVRFAQLYDKLSGDEREQAQITPGAQIPRLKASQDARALGDIVGGLLPEKATT